MSICLKLKPVPVPLQALFAMVSECFPKFENLAVTNPSSGVCHCRLSRSPVNALNTALWTELSSLLIFLEQHCFPNKIRVLIISSAARGNIFSAGNDLSELHVPSTSRTQFMNFWITATRFLSNLYKTPLYTIAAINGATPAGGCVISLCCDYRLALEDTSIGLNEVAIGLAVPKYWGLLLLRTVSKRSTGESMLASGTMISAGEALHIGLVDHVVSGDRSELLDAAMSRSQAYAKLKMAKGRADTKTHVREDFSKAWRDFAEAEAKQAWLELSEEQVKKTLGSIMKQLSQRANAKM